MFVIPPKEKHGFMNTFFYWDGEYHIKMLKKKFFYSTLFSLCTIVNKNLVDFQLRAMKVMFF